MHGVLKCRKNLNEKPCLYFHVFVTDREKATYPQELFACFRLFFRLFYKQSNSMIDVVTCSCTEPGNPPFNDKCRNLLIDVTKQVFL